MKEIKFSTWMLWAAILFTLVLATDYFFLHILFQESKTEVSATETSVSQSVSQSEATQIGEKGTDESFIEGQETLEEPQAISEDQITDNFFKTLQQCAPEIAAQTIGTPEALLAYLQNSVGIKKRDVALENYHLTLADGAVRRVHVIVDDNTNSKDKREIRFFKLDEEGYPERIPLPEGATLKSLLEMGRLDKHEVRQSLVFVDGSSIDIETHNKKVFEFQYNHDGRIFSCRYSNCHCSL